MEHLETQAAWDRKLSSDSGSPSGEVDAYDIATAFGWGCVSAISLVIGAAWGIIQLPNQSVRATFMAFGGGALLFALTLELFGEAFAAMHHGESDDDISQARLTIGIMICGAIAGGLLFAGLNKLLNEKGAFLRKPALVKGYLKNLRRLFAQGLVHKLRKVPLLAGLPEEDLYQLTTEMEKEKFQEGDTIFHDLDVYSSLYFIISGQVKIELRTPDLKKVDTLALINPKGQEDTENNHLSNGNNTGNDENGAFDSKPLLVANGSSSHEARPESISIQLPTVDEEEEAKMEGPDEGGGIRRSESMHDHALGDIVDTFIAGPNDLFGQMSLLAGMPLRAQATAMEATRVLRIPHKAVHRLLTTSKALQDHVEGMAVERLKEIDTFRHLRSATLARLVGRMVRDDFNAGDVLFYDVDALTPIYFVVLGEIEVTYNDDRNTTRCFTTNSIVGLEHLRHGRAVRATAVAQEHTTVLKIPRSDLDNLTRTDESLREALTADRKSLHEKQQRILSEADKKAGKGVSFAPTPAVSRRRIPTMAMRVSEAQQRAFGWERVPKDMDVGDLKGLDHQDIKRVLSTPIGPEDMHGASLRRFASGLPSPKAAVERRTTGALGIRRRASWAGSDTSPHGAREHLTSFENVDLLLTDDADPIAQLEQAHVLRQEEESEQVMERDKGEVSEHTPSTAPTSVPAPPTPPEGGKEEREVAGGEEKGGHGGKNAAVMIWLGILIDGIPESIVIGILWVTAGYSGMLGFLLGVFLSNLPEAMSSSGTMKANGMRKRVIMSMWGSIVIITGIGAAVGAALFPPGQSDNPETQMIIAATKGLAAGAMLTMIAQTMLPEAFDQGGDIIGLSCLAGFLAATAVKLLPIS
ncbi:unnamed protein product [Vitrella brassicaformis CCMP3155]|uniref:Cyclic nucleotide-binding domain-containing protein n=2 Tax=Vitrella brassicaformis TaxID=1169539 RepID=A0A0G4GS21_VITBC|nr:unnamed protein product [Vitrella brassicaformis CCMP3155]|eukprot:CEM33398.1 unnamed protein product [Vitrella brassicaformis CCMP3155]